MEVLHSSPADHKNVYYNKHKHTEMMPRQVLINESRDPV